MSKSGIFFSLFTILLINIASAQTDSSTISAEDAIEKVLQEPFEESDNSNLYDEFEQLIQNPVDLNSASISDLQQIPGIDLFTAGLIIDHRKKYGNFFSVYELNSVNGLDPELIKSIIPFITVQKTVETEQEIREAPGLLTETHLQLRSRIMNEFQTRRGFTNSNYVGTKPQVYNRLLIRQSDKLQLGLLTEKDPGEKSLNEFTSYHIYANDISFIHKIVVFDYILEFGQGLTMWSPYAFSKGADAIYPIKRNDRFIVAYRSATENNFFRGAAATINLDNFYISGFYSDNKFDASIDSVSGEIISTPVDGYHRTAGEISRRKTASEKMNGARIDYVYENLFKTGVLFYRSNFSNPFQKSSVFDYEGDYFSYTAAYYDFYSGNMNLFGEFSYNGTSVASINTILLSFSRTLTFAASIRNYPRNFFSLHGFAFGEKSGTTSNEFGIYTGIKWRLPFAIINFYYDQFKFPYATSSIPLPSEGDEYLVDISAKPFTRFELKLRYKNENKEITELLGNNLQLVRRIKQLERIELIYNLSNSLRIKGRVEINQFSVDALKKNETGFMVFQDIRFLPLSQLLLYARIIFFKTDSFDSAVYEYENNLAGILTNLPMYGEGIKWYFIARYRLLKSLAISLKYSEIYKPRENSLSSGLNEIDNNLDNDIAIQLDFQF